MSFEIKMIIIYTIIFVIIGLFIWLYIITKNKREEEKMNRDIDFSNDNDDPEDDSLSNYEDYIHRGLGTPKNTDGYVTDEIDDFINNFTYRDEIDTEKYETVSGKVGIIGCTPLASGYMTEKIFKQAYGDDAVCFGMGSGIDEVKRASECEKNIVVSTGGIKAAEYLKHQFGIPYETDFPVTEAMKKALENNFGGKKILVVHQQFAANKMRKMLQEKYDCSVDVGTFFKLFDEFRQDDDEFIPDEEQLVRKVTEGGYDAVIIDNICNRALKGYKGELIDLPHFAVSGRLDENGGQVCLLL